MKWIKSDKIPAGVQSAEIVDGQILSFLYSSGDGMVRVAKSSEWGGLAFYVPAPPKTVKKYKVSGKIEGFDIEPKTFDGKYEAESFKSYHEELVISEVEVEASE